MTNKYTNKDIQDLIINIENSLQMLESSKDTENIIIGTEYMNSFHAIRNLTSVLEDIGGMNNLNISLNQVYYSLNDFQYDVKKLSAIDDDLKEGILSVLNVIEETVKDNQRNNLLKLLSHPIILIIVSAVLPLFIGWILVLSSIVNEGCA